MSPQKEGPLLRALLANAPRMNFFRLCELIELSAPQRPPLGTTDSLADEPVRFRSSGGLGFPGREIDSVDYDDDYPDRPPVIRTAFLGLYGVDARMPSYFVDEIAQRRDGAEPLAAFLDLFHHRVVTQFYRVARKYRYPMGFLSGGQDEVSRYLLSLLGLGLREPGAGQPGVEHAEHVEGTVSPRKLLSMLGLASQRTRTAEGLAGVLQHAVPDARILVEEFYPVWVRLDATERMPLGENCVLGRGFYDCANAVRVVITPQTPESVLGLMPGRAIYREVMALLRFYLGHAAHAHLEMRVRPALMPAPVLNSNAVSLGYSTQLRCSVASANAPQEDAITRVRLGTWNGFSAGASAPLSHRSQ
ncbi:MAG: type VI secretion system baseplate subunit TssG [Burkholderiaceae bacterium]|jgi:type VI secretion system protein ImpH|uniref:Type VI secretion system baseplate subunit TssG n=1 Tax=Cupriavidus metallidurans TaxID=119219 RepID=A0A482IL14_9BURK|nr:MULTISPECIES: type VI secretion system baseplate subunit TssG [Cupriavidus]KWR81246.1 type VI secretion protein [Cupriavidus sp. SHE]PCH58567.1 MAG: type VI secretion system baseplate subunit TssG [Burkholderiaceae bacterium]QBP08821.1 type VI secretion system baseplate subunit TssG [Cupriavidus metallidurans]QWC89239.1 type VI secretion system baseplate subunit TssG [Cupriavidus metallidurans]